MLALLLLLPTQTLRPLPYHDPAGRLPSSYGEYAATQSDAPFRSTTSPRIGGFDRLVMVFVNSNLKEALAAELDTWYQDITADGYSVKEVACCGGRAANLRQILTAHRDSGLVGCVMVGDLPVAWWEDSNYGEHYPIDLFFEDLDGSFADNDGDGLYDSHSGSTAPDIWCGRIHATRLTYGCEEQLVRSYLQRNHRYRNGRLSVPRRGLVYNEVNWYPNDHGMSNLYSDITMFNDENTTTAAHYRNQLRLGYEFVHIITHSSPWVHSFFLAGDQFGAGSVFNFEFPALCPNVAFYFVNGCMSGRYTEKDCICNWELFAQPWAQALIASSQLMYGVNDVSPIYRSLACDSGFGAAFMSWYRTNYSSFRGTLILGDPTVHLDRTEQHSAPAIPPCYGNCARLDWSVHAVDTCNFVNGNPDIGCSQGRVRVIFDSGRIVRADNYCSYFDGTRFARPESIAWHEYYDLFPTCCTDASGRFWVVWQSFRDYSSYEHFQLFSSYWHNGTWSGVQRVGELAGYHDVQPAIASGTDDRVWCAFKSWRNGQGDIWVSSSQSGGAWSSPTRLSSDSLDQLDPCVTVDAQNHPWVFWTSLAGNRWQLHCRTYDGAWQPLVVIDTLGDNTAPRAALDRRGRVWVVWHKWLAGRSDIYYSVLQDSAWTEPTALTATAADDVLPAIAATPDGSVWACWQSRETSQWDIYASQYTDSWSAPAPVTNDAANDYDPVITCDTAGNVWAAWASDRRGFWNIYAAVGPVTGSAELPGATTDGFRAIPNPFRSQMVFRGPDRFEVEIFSVDGRSVAQLRATDGMARWTPERLPLGTYIARLTPGSAATLKLVYSR